MKSAIVSACALIAIAVNPTTAFPVDVEVAPSQDTYASNTSDDAGASYGTSQGLGLAQSRAGDWAQRAFIQFDLSAIPQDAAIQMAELSLYLGYHDAAAETQTCIRRVTQPWIEGAEGTHPEPRLGYDPKTPLTWKNQPGNDGVNWASLRIKEYPSGGMANEWVTWDVTKLVSAWHSGGQPNHGLVLTMWPQRGAHGYTFTSREGTYGGGPKLKVVYATDTKVSGSAAQSKQPVCRLLADSRLEEAVQAIVEEYRRRTGAMVRIEFTSPEQIAVRLGDAKAQCDAVICLEPKTGGPVGALKGAEAVAYTHEHPAGDPVWAAPLSDHPDAERLVKFFGGATGHRLWSERSDLTIVPDMTPRSYDWVVKHRVAHTYPMTAERILRECGGIRDGVCVDIGCGTGMLDVELV